MNQRALIGPKPSPKADHDDLFRARLGQIINMRHALVRLAERIHGARFGYNRDKRADRPRIVYGLLCDRQSFSFCRREEAIAAEARLDGFYAVRTNLPGEVMEPDDVVGSYKSLVLVEPAFRSFKSVDLQVRPVYHWRGPRVRAHLFLCMLAYYVEWHMRERLAPILHGDHDKAQGESASIVAPRALSRAGERKNKRRRTDDGVAVTSWRDLLRHLGTLSLNTVAIPINPNYAFTVIATPTELQQKAFELLGVKPIRDQ